MCGGVFDRHKRLFDLAQLTELPKFGLYTSSVTPVFEENSHQSSQVVVWQYVGSDVCTLTTRWQCWRRGSNFETTTIQLRPARTGTAVRVEPLSLATPVGRRSLNLKRVTPSVRSASSESAAVFIWVGLPPQTPLEAAPRRFGSCTGIVTGGGLLSLLVSGPPSPAARVLLALVPVLASCCGRGAWRGVRAPPVMSRPSGLGAASPPGSGPQATVRHKASRTACRLGGRLSQKTASNEL